MIADFFFPAIALESRSALGHAGVDVAQSLLTFWASVSPLLLFLRCSCVCLLIHRYVSPIYFVGVLGSCFIYVRELSFQLICSPLQLEFCERIRPYRNHLREYFLSSLKEWTLLSLVDA